MGTLATAAGTNAMAFGAGASAGFAGSTAIGAGATTARANQIAVGTDTNTYTMAGINSADSTAAQTGPVRFVTADAAGNLATTALDIATLDGRVGNLEGRVGSIDGRINGLDGRMTNLEGRIDQAFEGAAMAMAMAGGGLPGDKNFAVSINWGNFAGQNAFAGTAHARINDNLFVHGGVGVGANSGTVGGRAGMTFAW